LYPALGPERSILLCEGELDALAARSAGIPACSVTLGVSRWLPEWTTTLARRRVAICFDVGAEEVAESRAALLRTARVIQLEGPDGYDITDFLREHSPRGLKQLLGVQCR
jgi:DNA primase